MANQKPSLVRTIYLYLFTIVGLALLVIGSVRFIDMGLKTFVFKKADAPQRLQEAFSCQQFAPLPVSKLEIAAPQPLTAPAAALTPEEESALKNFLANYKRCLEQGGQISYLSSQRQRDASLNLAMMLVGLPLYLYHWGVISKETRQGEREDLHAGGNNGKV